MKCGIDINAAFYRGYLIDDRNLTPHVAALVTLVALWSLVYLVGCLAPAAKPTAEVAAQWSSPVVPRLAP
jgi:hypothetical protein